MTNLHVRPPVWLVVALASCGCSVDERRLELGSGAQPSDGGDGGMAGAPSGHAGSDTGGGDGGSAGATASGDLVDGCADLDTDGVADCEATLVETPSFSSDVSGWTAVGDATLTWDAKNALEDLPSGSAKLSGSGSLASAAQCVAIDGERLVIGYANAFVEAAAESDEPAHALLEVSFFQGVACSGDSDGFFETPPSAGSDVWVTIHAGGLSKPTTRSLSIALVGSQPVPTQPLNVYFDNVMLKTEVADLEP